MAELSNKQLEMFQTSILEYMKENRTMSQTAFETWFNDFRLVYMDEKKFVFATSAEYSRKVINDRYFDFVTKCVREALDMSPTIEVICDGVPSKDMEFSLPARLKREKEEQERKNLENRQSIGLNPDFTFDNFVVGSSNLLAHACCIAVADDPNGPHGYNPLFIYGPSGLGKTHLMYAIANKIHEKYPEKVIIIVKSEQFLNELVEGIAKKTMNQFREKYRKADVLLIDDVQFISGKESTQEEFFHTFEALQEDRKQIVLTSDRPPKEIYTLQERIKTRFTQGMIVDVQPPEYELRLAIIKKKAEKANMNIPSDVLAFLAEKLNSNIREIEGALKKIGAVSFLQGVPITLEMVKSSIPEYFRENKPVAQTVDSILEVTARKYEVSVEQILGKSRTKDIKTARNVAMYVIKKVLDLSLPAIGKMMNRDHSTVYSNIQMIENDLETNDRLNNDIIEIITEIKTGN